MSQAMPDAGQEGEADPGSALTAGVDAADSRRVPPKMWVLVLTTVAVVAVDQAVKWLVTSSLQPGDSVVLVSGVLDLTHVRNPGAAFGWLSHWTSAWKLASFASVGLAAGVVSVLLYRGLAPRERGRALALGLVLGGTIGNFTDRVARGAVVDFLHFNLFGGFRWPDFNVADLSLVAGAVFLLVELLAAEGRERALGHRSALRSE